MQCAKFNLRVVNREQLLYLCRNSGETREAVTVLEKKEAVICEVVGLRIFVISRGPILIKIIRLFDR